MTRSSINAQEFSSESINAFDISHYSIYDGRGTRVVVFFQGCSARCIWCHSPHSQYRKNTLLYDAKLCSNCGRCGSVCENNVHRFENNSHKVYRENCIGCGKCVEACPNSYKYRQAGALHLPVIPLSVKSLFEKLQPHLNVTKYEGGGITLSGGEALLQQKASKELLIMCKDNHINTAVETSGLLPPKYYKNLEGLVDCWLYGMRFTTNYPVTDHTKTILKSFKIIADYKSEILPRIPVVPGHTDCDWYLQRCFNLLKTYGIHCVFISPWNLSVNHYYDLGGFSPPELSITKEEAEKSAIKMKKYFNERNIAVREVEYI